MLKNDPEQTIRFDRGLAKELAVACVGCGAMPPVSLSAIVPKPNFSV